MIHRNPIIFKKLSRSDIVRKNFTTKNIIKSIIFREFKILFIKNNVDNFPKSFQSIMSIIKRVYHSP